jgi:GT2 family glycosyltransferase
MDKRVAIIISPNWRDYAEKYLFDCLESVKKQDFLGESKIFLVDNESTNESLAMLNDIVETKNFASAQIVKNENNDGFAKGNNDAIRLALEQEFDYVILFNMDTVVEKDCVRKMVEAVENENSPNPLCRKGAIGAVQARLMLWPDKEKINSLGNMTHFLGFGYCEGYGERYNPPTPLYQGGDICYPSGAAVLFTAEVLKKIGLFDEEFWMYNEDQDFGWRIWLAGFKCVLAPEAVVYHKYEFNKSIKQYYWMDRNRIIAIIKNYHFLTLLLIFPAWLVMELGLVLFSLKQGWFGLKIKVWLYFLNPKNWAYLWKARIGAQALRQAKDKDIVKMFSGKIWYQEIGDWKLELVNPVFQVYWWAVKKIIFW